MNQYIRDFNVEKIRNFVLENADQAKQVLKVNSCHCNFKIIHNNIRSIAKNLDEFIIFLEELDSSIDCIVLTETRIIDDIGV